MKAPVAVHIDGMVYYNKDVADEGRRRPDAVEVDGRRLRRLRQDQGGRLHPDRAGRRQVPGGPISSRRSSPPRPAPTSTTSFYGGEAGPRRDRLARDAQGARPLPPDLSSTSIRARRTASGTTPPTSSSPARRCMQIHGDWMKGEFARRRQGSRQGLRLHQHPRHQGAGGDRRRLGLPQHQESRDGARRRRTSPRSPSIRRSTPTSREEGLDADPHRRRPDQRSTNATRSCSRR